MTVSVNTAQLKDLSRALKKAAPELGREFDAGLLKIGIEAAIVAQRMVAPFDAQTGRIQRSIRARRLTRAVSIQAGGAGAPHAAAFEHRGRPGIFRHPVFRTAQNPNTWAPQRAHPYLHPAAEAQIAHAGPEVSRLVDETMRKAGFH